MPLADIVNVVVTKASSSVSRVGFGTILIAAYHTENTDRVTTYSASTALATMVADGFATTDARLSGDGGRALAESPRQDDQDRPARPDVDAGR
jgi:predicted nucleic acid-binding protein